MQDSPNNSSNPSRDNENVMVYTFINQTKFGRFKPMCTIVTQYKQAGLVWYNTIEYSTVHLTADTF